MIRRGPRRPRPAQAQPAASRPLPAVPTLPRAAAAVSGTRAGSDVPALAPAGAPGLPAEGAGLAGAGAGAVTVTAARFQASLVRAALTHSRTLMKPSGSLSGLMLSWKEDIL